MNCRSSYSEFLQATKAMHQELTIFRSMVDTRSRVRLVELKTLMPDRFGKKNGPSWRTWSTKTSDEDGREPKAAFGVTNEMDQEFP